MHGLLVIDKPLGISSREAVNRALKWFPRKTKLGHTGTLDPLATGVLVLTIGHATRLADFVQAMKKRYVADVKLGGTSATDDAEGPIDPVANPVIPHRGQVEAALASMVGRIAQIPPAFSAVKVEGERAYAAARKQKPLPLQAREVEILGIQVLAYQYPDLRIDVRCGKGTYIRSIARDLGASLGCGGYLNSLRRTEVGSIFHADLGVPMSADPETAHVAIMPMVAAVAELPRLVVDRELSRKLRHGQTLVHSSPESDNLAVVDEGGNLVAICSSDGRTVKPLKVIPE